MDEWLDRHKCILAEEPKEHAGILYHRSYFISNAIMASIPNHPFWQKVLRELVPVAHFYDPLPATGPTLITKVYDQYIHNPQLLRYPVYLAGPEYFMPIADDSGDLAVACSFRAAMADPITKAACEALWSNMIRQKIKPESFTVHRWTHYHARGNNNHNIDTTCIGDLIPGSMHWEVALADSFAAWLIVLRE